jgi:hypothetical protein
LAIKVSYGSSNHAAIKVLITQPAAEMVPNERQEGGEHPSRTAECLHLLTLLMLDFKMEDEVRRYEKGQTAPMRQSGCLSKFRPCKFRSHLNDFTGGKGRGSIIKYLGQWTLGRERYWKLPLPHGQALSSLNDLGHTIPFSLPDFR